VIRTSFEFMRCPSFCQLQLFDLGQISNAEGATLGIGHWRLGISPSAKLSQTFSVLAALERTARYNARMPELPLDIDCRSTRLKLDAGGDFLLIDCRELDEHATARIEGSRLLPMSEIAARIGELEPFRDHEIVVHCHHGGRSRRVANWLREQGFPRAQSMDGGIDRWSIEIDPRVPRY
jgi:rhodanese-related sulfurtransferase